MIIQHTGMSRAQVQRGELAYTVLLIIADGIINDMAQTRDALVLASDVSVVMHDHYYDSLCAIIDSYQCP